MKKKTLKILISLLILVLILAIYLVVFQVNFTGNAVKNYSLSFTKAFCDENKNCRDYEITCKGKNLISMNPIGYAVKIDNPNAPKLNSTNTENLCD